MTEQIQQLIPTDGKRKLPSTHSWPLAAKEASEALQFCVQYQGLRLYFAGIYTNSYDVTPKKEQTLLRAAHSISLSDEIDEDHGSQEFLYCCTLWIYPVLREHRKVLHDNLVAKLPLLRDWLNTQAKRRVLDRSSFEIIWEYYPNSVVVREVKSVETERIR